MPTNPYANVTEEQLRQALAGGRTFHVAPEAAQAYSEMFPSLSAQLEPWLPKPKTPATAAVPTTPTTTGRPARGAPDLAVWQQLVDAMQSAQQRANLARIPGAAGLEQSSSDMIASLLNPPAFFADTSRQAAELGAARGIGGSAAAYSTGVRMTDEERLKRMALGQQMLSAATARNPVAELISPLNMYVTPYQRAQLDVLNERNRLARERWEWERKRLEQPSITYSNLAGDRPGTSGGRTSQYIPGGPPTAGGRVAPGMLEPPPSEEGYEDYGNLWRDWPYATDVYDPTGGYLPLYPGGPTVGENVGGESFYPDLTPYVAGQDYLGPEGDVDLSWLDLSTYGYGGVSTPSELGGYGPWEGIYGGGPAENAAIEEFYE